MIAGNPATVFDQPESAVITESAAKKYFGNAPAVGKTLRVGGQCLYGPGVEGCPIREATVLVTGIVRDLPHNTQLTGDVFIPNTSAADPMSQTAKQAWLNNSGFGYVQLAPNADPRSVEKKLATLIDRSVDLNKMGGVHLPASQVMVLGLTPFRDVHLSGDGVGGLTPGGSWTMVAMQLIAIAVLILLVACFNFTNLATARRSRARGRSAASKTVGARRVARDSVPGASTVLISLLSLVLALLSPKCVACL